MRTIILLVISLCTWSVTAGTNDEELSMEIYANLGTQEINADIYGHFSEHLGRCIYEGFWVGLDSEIPNTRGIRNDVVESLKQLSVPVLRWPGGCFADEYHWKDGIGPYEQRPSMINTHWGGVSENNHFGTHEFLDLCGQLGCEPYICGNVGSGEVKEMQEWVEYITFDGKSPMADWRRRNGRDKPWNVRFWGVGNENWGCGGNMRPQYYADLYKRYQTYLRNFSGNKLFKIACGSYNDDYDWTEVLMREAAGRMHGLSFHYYTVTGTWQDKGSATQFTEAEYFTTLKKALHIDDLIQRHSTIMDKYDPEKRIGLMVDEWGTWHEVEPGTNPGFLYQQNTMRDAMVAALTLHIFHKHCDRVRMANIAQTVNVLQSMILTQKDGMILTPTYWVFELFKNHQNARMLPVSFDSGSYKMNGEAIQAVSASASKQQNGSITVSFCNVDPHKPRRVRCKISGQTAKSVNGRILTAGEISSHNTFEKPDVVKPTAFGGAQLEAGEVIIDLPSKSIAVLDLY
ncbi:alpha-N-arabinofuranosidase [candidate division KSB1 bacterium]|nr:alpha-N-arabinofuranosidase [candidate division KSB1 bacterium]